MRRITEFPYGGLVTARDPSILSSGELTQCDNITYTPWSQSPRRAVGRVAFGSTFGTLTNGLGVAQFDNGNAFLFALDANTLNRTTLTGVVSIGAIENFAGTGLNNANYGDWVFLFNGTANNRVVRNDGTLRDHGLIPVINALGYTVSTVTGAWLSTQPGWFEYWTTEIAEFTENGTTTTLESSFEGVPASVYIADVNKRVTITRPALINSTATKWRVYRSVMKVDNSSSEFPVGMMVAELPIATNEFIDGVPSVAAYIFASTPDGTVWTNPSNVSSDNGVYATTSVTGAGPALPPIASDQIYMNFGFTGLVDPIVGIEAEIESKVTNSLGASLSVNISDGAYGEAKTATLRAADTITVLGGPNDLWGRFWAATGFSNTNFRLRLRAENTNLASTTFSVDYVKIRIYHAGGVATGTIAFPFITIDVEGVMASTPSHGIPPKAISGDVFQDSLVLTNGSNVFYSLAGEPEYFPTLYFLPVPSIHPTTLVKRVGDRLVLGTRGSIFRINYLPTEMDASFNRGIMLHEISPDFGPVGPKAAVTFTSPTGTELAFVSRQGLMATNGHSVRTLTEDLDWSFLVNEANLSNIKLINNPERWELVMYYPNGASIDKKLHFNYHPGHLKGDKLKVSGPVDALDAGNAPNDVAVYQHTDGTTRVYSAYAGYLRVDSGLIAAASVPTLTTRQIPIAGFANEAILQEVYPHHQNTGATITCTPLTQKTRTAEQTGAAKTFLANFAGNSKLNFNISCEGVRLKFTEAAGLDVVYDYFTLSTPNSGSPEDSNKAPA